MLPLIQRLMLPNVNGSTFVIIINPQKKKVFPHHGTAQRQ